MLRRRAPRAPRRAPRRRAARPSTGRGRRAAPAGGRLRRRAASGRRARSRRRGLVARRREAVVEHDAGGCRRLGEDLGIVEVEAAAEREPGRGEHERGAAAGLGGQPRHAHGGRHLGREALGPDERQPQRGGALLGGAAHGRGADGVGGEAASGAARSAHAGVQETSSNARSTRSATRYVNGQERSKKNCARERSAPRSLRASSERLPPLREPDHVAHLSSLA